MAPPPRTDLFGKPIDQSMFLNPSFNTESYISGTFVPFETLRPELQSHLTFLKNESVELLNRDYNDFVNLTSKLVDVDGALLRMREPLVEFREKVVGFRSDLEMSLSQLKSGLRDRSVASQAREVLELMINTSHLVSKVEKLIKELHSVSVDGSNGDLHTGEKSHLSNGVSKQHSKNGTDLRKTQSMLLERIASEMSRLKFYFAHAK
ncbi:conserved oligomeric Golgi complex subunit 2, partial [Tanacetum coccineum]